MEEWADSVGWLKTGPFVSEDQRRPTGARMAPLTPFSPLWDSDRSGKLREFLSGCQCSATIDDGASCRIVIRFHPHDSLTNDAAIKRTWN
jgi:hypothetical protein